MASKTYYRPKQGKHRWHVLHYGLVGEVGMSLCGIPIVIDARFVERTEEPNPKDICRRCEPERKP